MDLLFSEKRSDAEISDNTHMYLQINIVADYYKLPGLAKLTNDRSNDRVGQMLGRYWRPNIFCNILLHRNLRAIVHGVAAGRMPELVKEPKFKELEAIGSLGYELLCQVASPR